MADYSILRDRLKTVCKTVYINPPTNTRMTYPCFRCTVDSDFSARADNTLYHLTLRYQVMYISRDEERDIIQKTLEAVPMSSFDRAYTADDLWHAVFTVYN